jgi:hypothetical protein
MSRARDFADLAGSADAGGLTGRNLIINGAMQVDQRNITATADGYTLDRFRADHSTDGAFSVAQNTTSPADFEYSLKWTVTTADASLAATQYAYIRTRLEGNSVAHLNWGTSDAKAVTLSFYIRSSVTGTFGGAVWNGAFDRSYPFTYTVSSADTWEKKTITISGDTTGTWLTDTDAGLNLAPFASAGSTYSGTAGAWAGAGYVTATGATNIMSTLNATIYITGVQLEVGETATPFEHRSYGDELARCQRYYFRWNAGGNSIAFCGGAFNNGTSNSDGVFTFPVRMRIAPTALEQSGTAANYRIISVGVGSDCTSVPTFLSANVDNIRVRFTNASSLTSSACSTLAASSTTGANAYLGWSAEL